MQERFTLRFETGERAGEAIPVPAAGMTVGRKPGNTLVIADVSVSGRHAELHVAGDSLSLRDLGSTNGTRVGNEKVENARLAHGDRVIFGSVALVVQDAALAEKGASSPKTAETAPSAAPAGPSAAPARPSAAAAGEAVARVDAASLARGGRRSKAGLLILLVVVAAGGGAAWYFLGGGGGEARGARQRPVETVAGNLLADGYSFEADTLGWETADGASAFFERSPAARFAGAQGMRANLQAGEAARLVSPAVQAREGGNLRLVARLRVSGEAAGRVGIELLGPAREDAEPRSLVAFGPWLTETPEHESIEFELPVPAGFERARVVAEALGQSGDGGRADLDDVALLATATGREPDARFAEYRLYLVGKPAQALQLQKVARPLVGDLHYELHNDEQRIARDVPLSLTTGEGRFTLSAELGGSAEPRLVLWAADGAVAQGLATIADDVYQLQRPDFEQEGVRTLLIGDGADLVGLNFAEPVRVRSRSHGGDARIEVRPAPRELVVQLDFGAEHAQAGLQKRMMQFMSDWFI